MAYKIKNEIDKLWTHQSFDHFWPHFGPATYPNSSFKSGTFQSA